MIEKKQKEGLTEATLEKQRWLLKLLGTEFGRRPVAEIAPQELLHELKKHERRGRLETAKQLRAFASRVFRFAAATARAERDPAQLLLGALITPTVKHFPAIIDPAEFGALLRAIEDYQGDPSVMYALKLTPQSPRGWSVVRLCLIEGGKVGSHQNWTPNLAHYGLS